MSERNCLVLSQYREGTTYNDFIGKYYHFPQSYLNQFDKLPIEFIYHEPQKLKPGKGEFFGYGKISKPPFEDKREEGFHFVEIEEYKQFAVPVSYKNSKGEIIEELRNPHYNSGNSVRKIPSDLLDEICLDGKILLNFQADAHLIQILGEQLIASERVGILELIKNSYDAQASFCNISIFNIPNIPEIEQEEEIFYHKLSGPVIVIEDDGIGMDRNVIENGWLRPASRIKTNVKDEIREQRNKAIEKGNLGMFNSWLKEYKSANKGRLPLGEKGVGRFATHRLGSKLLLTTKPANQDYEFILEIDWDNFDTHSSEMVDLESVGVSLSRQEPSRDYGNSESGTRLVIYGGREGFNITKRDIQDIFDSIQSLNSPFTNPFSQAEKQKGSFEVNFSCPQLEHELKNETIYDIAPPVFTFDAIIDELGKMQYDLHFNPPMHSEIPYSSEKISGEFDLRLSHGNHYKSSDGSFKLPKCGPFFMHLDIWYRVSPWIASSNVSKARDWLDNYGGIALYRDFVNLFPADWGANYDWLKLSKRHIQKGSSISYYNMNGYIEVFQDSNLELIDKTDRQGLLENEAFEDLTRLVQTIVLNFIETEFKGRRDDFTTLKKNIRHDSKEYLAKTTNKSALLIDSVLSNYKVDEDPFNILTNFGNPKDREANLVNLQGSLQNLEKNIKQIMLIEERLVENAGFGLSAAIAIHELAKITGNFYNGITKLIKTDQLDKVRLKDLQDAASSLKSELKNLSPLRSIRNEPVKPFEVSRAIEYAIEFYKRTFESLGIEFAYNKEEDFVIKERFGTLAQILTNLIDNSCYWLDKDVANTDKIIMLVLDKEKRTIIVADNGPGIDRSILPYLYQPGASLKTPPSGLGLYICQYYLNRMKGQIGLTNEKDRIQELKGAQFTLDFSRVDEN